MNVDQEEVQKFDAMAANWWDPEGSCKPLHDLNPIRLEFIQSCCDLQGKILLDIGCGGGILTESLSTVSKEVTGLDQSAEALKVATEHGIQLDNPPRYVLATAEDYAKTHPQTFDVIICLEMLEHVPDPSSIIAACAKLLKPQGHLFFSTLNRTPKAFLQAIIGAEYLLRVLPRGTHTYDKFIRPSELAKWARSYGFKVQTIKGVQYQILSKRYTLSDDVSVNYLMHFVKEDV
jgi:2-polyprenyl-6-hydroxyphenyl methylase / 3-demethylubiquinone-9 3-methyltransferase